MPITQAQIAEWRAVLEAATPEPWRGTSSKPPGVNYVHAKGVTPNIAKFHDPANGRANAAFVVTARQAMPSLLDELERVLAQRDAFLAMLTDVLASAHPNHRDHPTMFEAWARADRVVRSGVYEPRPQSLIRRQFIEGDVCAIEIEPVRFGHEGGGPHRSCDACLAVVDSDGDLVHARGCGAAKLQAKKEQR